MASLLVRVPENLKTGFDRWAHDCMLPLMEASDADIASITLLSTGRSRMPVEKMARALSDIQILSDLGATIEFCELSKRVWITMPGGLLKTEIETQIMISLKRRFPRRFAGSSLVPLKWVTNVSVKKAQRTANVGLWRRKPFLAQQKQPIKNRISCPELWIEVFNETDYHDKKRAMDKPAHVLKMVNDAGGTPPEFAVIALPAAETYHANAAPTQHGTFAPATGRRAPYVAHWPPGQNAPTFYKVTHRKEVLPILSGTFDLKFSWIIDALTGRSERRFATIDELHEVKSEIKGLKTEVRKLKEVIVGHEIELRNLKRRRT